ncbi:MAG: hypothetical protein U1E25_15670 [Methylocystis sp.]
MPISKAAGLRFSNCDAIEIFGEFRLDCVEQVFVDNFIRASTAVLKIGVDATALGSNRTVSASQNRSEHVSP